MHRIARGANARCAKSTATNHVAESGRLSSRGLTVERVFLSEPVVFDQFWANSMVHVYLILSACET